MTKLSIATSLALATLAATLAATPSFAMWPDVNPNFTYRADSTGAAEQSYAAAPGAAFAGSRAVIVAGKVVGADPDPNVRLQLLKDADALYD